MSEPSLAAGPAADNSGDSGQSFGAPVGDSVQGLPSQQQEQESGINPAWKPVLDVLPSEFHKMIQPHLQSWDKNYQETFGKLNEVQSQLEPYAELIENQVDPQQILQALQLAAVIDADPKAFYDNMAAFYKWGQGQETSEDPEDFSLGGGEEFNIEQHPKFQELMQNQQVLAQYLQSQIQTQETEQQEQQLIQTEQALIEKHGDTLDMGTVYKLAMANGGNLEAAADEYMQMYTNIRSAPTPGSLVPKPFAPNGAVPSNQPDPAKMGSKDTISLVKEILAANNQGN
jgi:hypothetical protein